MIPFEIIACKRDGKKLTDQQIERIVAGYVAGDVGEGEMAAWLMAVYLNGLDLEETVALTRAMLNSGTRVDLTGVPGPVVDKHSTGGVGDKVTLVVTPLAAAAGIKVAKLSGRALGHTGGTLDKLESIPGFSTNLSIDRFVCQVKTIGAAVAAQSSDFVPADKLIYSLRDRTATVASAPLIAASIISKKAAGGAGVIVIDVKAGTGAFMKNARAARDLASILESVGSALGLKVKCVISAMDEPLGLAVGDALEVTEAIDCLGGGGPADLRGKCLDIAALMLSAAGAAAGATEARRRVVEALDSGRAKEMFKALIAAQGGDERVVEDSGLLPKAARSTAIFAGDDGYFQVDDCERLGAAAAVLSGRYDGDVYDPGAGLIMRAKNGAYVGAGQAVIETRYGQERRFIAARPLIEGAFTVSPKASSSSGPIA